VAASDISIAISTELSLGDVVQQIYERIIDDVPARSEVDALLEIVKLITANYSGHGRYPDLIEGIYHHLKDEFMQYGHVEYPRVRP
jgi:hypothetical protein